VCKFGWAYLVPAVLLGREAKEYDFLINLFCCDFQKINGRIKIFEKCTSGVVPHGGMLLPS
jgi:hypothetical protein